MLTAVVFGAYMNGSYKRVSMSVIERKSQNMIYSDTCETGARHMRSFADCLAKHWKRSLGGGKTKMRKFTAADLEGIRDEQAEKVSVRNASDTVLAKITSHPVPAALILQGATVPKRRRSPWQMPHAAGKLKKRRQYPNRNRDSDCAGKWNVRSVDVALLASCSLIHSRIFGTSAS